jgi:hypothetical protein
MPPRCSLSFYYPRITETIPPVSSFPKQLKVQVIISVILPCSHALACIHIGSLREKTINSTRILDLKLRLECHRKLWNHAGCWMSSNKHFFLERNFPMPLWNPHFSKITILTILDRLCSLLHHRLQQEYTYHSTESPNPNKPNTTNQEMTTLLQLLNSHTSNIIPSINFINLFLHLHSPRSWTFMLEQDIRKSSANH